jgi:hypothetical protein
MSHLPWGELDRRGSHWPYNLYEEERCCDFCDAWDAMVSSARQVHHPVTDDPVARFSHDT